MSDPVPTGPRSQNPYCMRCSKHLGIAFHETNEHDEAQDRAHLHQAFEAIMNPTDEAAS